MERLGCIHPSGGWLFLPAAAGGKVNVALGGIDYAVGDNLTVGVAVSDERTWVELNFNGGKIIANGNTVAPYLGWRITPNWLMDATIGFGSASLSSSDNSVAGGITGNNKDKRTLASAGLAYNHVMGQWLITAKGGLSTSEDKFSSFTLSNNTFVPGLTSRTTQARLGGQAAYNMGNLVPFFGVAYVNDIQRPNQAPVDGQNAANDRDGWQLSISAPAVRCMAACRSLPRWAAARSRTIKSYSTSASGSKLSPFSLPIENGAIPIGLACFSLVS